MNRDVGTARDGSRTVGVLGGMGPAATLDFFAKILKGTAATCDQEHLHLIIDNNPHVPNRNEWVAGMGPSPGPALVEMARRLEQAGADFLVLPCNAAHVFQDRIRQSVSIPLLSIIDETRDALLRRFPGTACVGVLASTGCIDAQLYQRAFGEAGVEVVVPIGGDRDTFMDLLCRIKAGDLSSDTSRAMRVLAAHLIARGADVLVAGCTEVPLVLDGSDLPRPLVDSTAVLVERTISFASRLNQA